MFGFGVAREASLIESMLPTLASAFEAQMEQLRLDSKVNGVDWDACAVFAFPVWSIHLAIVNLNKSSSKTITLQQKLNDAVNNYIAINNHIFEILDHDNARIDLRKANLLLDKLSNSVKEYNYAFNMDKARSLNYAGPDWRNEHIVALIISSVARTAASRKKLNKVEPIISQLATELMLLSRNAFAR